MNDWYYKKFKVLQEKRGQAWMLALYHNSHLMINIDPHLCPLKHYCHCKDYLPLLHKFPFVSLLVLLSREVESEGYACPFIIIADSDTENRLVQLPK